MDRRRRRGAFGLTLALLCVLGLVVTPGPARADTAIDVAHCDQTDLQSAITANAGGGTITFSADCTIQLTSPLDLSAGPVTIDGTGHTVVLDGQGSTRIFDDYGAATGSYTLSHLTLEHAYVGGGGNGGAIRFTASGADLTLSHDTFIDNEVGSIENGGAVDAKSLTVTDSTFTGNSAGYGGQGGAVYIEDNGGLSAADDTFSGNSVGLYGEGGAVFIGSSTSSSISTSTFSGNSTGDAGYGGAIATLGQSGIVLSTLSGNSVGASGVGNAIADLSVADPVSLQFSTIAGNTGGGASALYDANGASFGIDYSLFSANGTDCGGPGSWGFSDASYNLTDTDGASCNFTDPTTTVSTDAHLAPLGDYGGPTQTMALQATSPAVARNGGVSCGNSTDQRGFPQDPGNCSIGAYAYDTAHQYIGTCDEATLDAAVAAAAAASPGTVKYGRDCTTNLTSAVTLPDSSDVTVDGNGHTVILDGGGSTRIFDFEQSSGNLTVKNLELDHGNSSAGNGGAIEFTTAGTLELVNDTFADNAGGMYGGAVDGTNVVVENSTFTGNTAETFGGAVSNSGSGTYTDDTFVGSSTGFGGVGGAVIAFGATTTITGSTFEGNSVGDAGRGGALALEAGDTMVTNSTFSGNSAGAGSDGAAIGDDATSFSLKNATIVDNSGAAAIELGDLAEIGWTLFSGNGTDCSGFGLFADNGHNLTDTNGSSCGFSGGSGDTVNTDAHLGSLADNGGPTRTYALTQLSPPIATDTHADCGLSHDQRGVARNGVCSIGAYQYDTTSQTISTCDDATAYGAMKIAANGESPSTVTFACDGTIDLSSPVTVANGVDLTINGTGHDVVLDGQGSTRIFDDENPLGNLTLQHLTLQHGNAGNASGGAIEFTTAGTLTISGSTLRDNSVNAEWFGGAVDATNLSISNSTLADNTAGDFGAGGGVVLEGGSGTLTNDTFSSNSVGAEGGGGAFFDYGGTSTVSGTTFDGNSAALYGEGGAVLSFFNSTDTITNSTFSGNSAGFDGSAIYSYYFSSETLASDTVVGNTGGASAVSSTYDSSLQIGSTLFAGNGTDCYTDGPSIADAGYNLAEDGSCGFTNGVNNDIISSTPRVMPLGNYGGSTETVALQSTSPAVDAGSCALSTDQRGVSRPQGGSCDIGAYEASPVAPVTSLQLSPASPNGRNGWYTTAPQATLTPTNPNSATVSTFYGVNDPSCESAGTCTSYSAPFSLTDGLNTLSYYSQDDTPAFEGSNTRVVKVDTTAPATSFDGGGYTAGTWTNQDVTFAVSGSDATSGVANSYYEVDRGSITRYSSPVTVSAEGKHRVVYRSIDNAGNVETWNTAMVLIDKTAPTLSGSPTTTPNANGWYHSNVTIKWSCSDALSGIASCPANSTISTEGANVTANGTDFDTAGNSTNAASSAVNIDKTAPTTAGALSTSGFHSGSYYAGPVTLTLTPSDSLSGLDTTYYSIDGGTAQVYSTPVSYDTVGKHVFRYWSTDLAGNVEAQHVLGFNLIHPPGAPTLGSLTRGVRSLGVSWSAPSDAGGDLVRSYVITYVNQTTSVSATKTVPASPTSATLTGLANGTTYSVTVQAVDAAGAGPASSGQTGTTYGLPDAPTSFSATLADRGAGLSWRPGTSDGGTAVTSYALMIIGGGSSTSQSFDPSTACTVSGCNANVSGLTNGVWYTLRLWAVNAAGKSVSYASSTVKPLAVPGKPTSVGASGGVRSAVVTWEPPSATGGGIASYTITATGGATPVVKTVTTGSACASDPCTATIGGLGNGIAYTITVAASNAAGTSAPSDPASATTKAAPGLPTSFTATPGSASADLAWHAPASDGGSPISGYRLRVYSGSSLVNTISVNCTTANCSYTLTGLTGGVTYTLYVNAVNAVGNGGSASATVTPS